MIQRRVLVLLLLVTISLSTGSKQVSADMSPPPPQPTWAPAWDFSPGLEATQVRMEAETVTVTILAPGSGPDKNGRARVTAEFHMRNLGDQTETMDARFPLLGGINENFEVWVNEIQAPVTSTTQESGYQIATGGDFPLHLAINRWALFPVTFPPGEEVIVRVSYNMTGLVRTFDKAEPQNFPSNAYVTFFYILKTGAAWKDTIGTVDLAFQFPYDLTVLTLADYWPKPTRQDSRDTVVVGSRSITWHFEDYEPTYENDPGVTIINPTQLQAMELEKQVILENPNDGDAWARLAKAYKDNLIVRKFETGQESSDLYRLGIESYRKAIALQPDNASLHLGYADLVYWFTKWKNYYPNDQEYNRLELMVCAEQLNKALENEPDNEYGAYLLTMLANDLPDFVPFTVVDLSGPEPEYPILTLRMYTPTRTVTPTHHPSYTPFPTNTPQPSITSTKTKIAAATITVVAALATTQPPVASTRRPDPWIGMVTAVALISVIAAAWLWKKHKG